MASFTMNPVPRDLTKREHIARVTRVIYESADQTYVILGLHDGFAALGSASADQFDVGSEQIYRFMGRWAEDNQRRWQFKFDTFVLHRPGGQYGIVKYLTDLIPGVGTKTATKLWMQYGADTIEVIQSDPDRVKADLPDISPETIDDASYRLRADKAEQSTRIELFGLFERRGFSGHTIKSCIARWGAKAGEVIRKNPYKMLGLPGAGFKRCDRLWVDLGHPVSHMKRQVMTLAHLAKQDRTGNTWMSADSLANRLTANIPDADILRAFKIAIRARILEKKWDHEGLWVALKEHANQERRIHAAVVRLMAGPVLWPVNEIQTSQKEGDRLPSSHQVEKLKHATQAAVGIFCGGPGTGKSHTLAYLARAIIADYGRSAVAVCAPTGKAANRARESLRLAGLSDIRVSTIHTLLQIGRNGHDGDGWGFQRNAGNPLEVKFLLVDEPSMIDTALMASLLDACATGTQILLIGDPNQLPPVGHGAPLRDLIAAGVPCGQLSEVRRNAGTIVHACRAIHQGDPINADMDIDLAAEPPKNLKLVPTTSEAKTVEYLLDLLKRMTAFNKVWQTQVIVARNKGSVIARREVNDLLQNLFNAKGMQAGKNPFRVDDKVICLRNGMYTAMTLPPETLEMIEDRRMADGTVVNDPTVHPKNWVQVMETDDFTGREVAKEVYVANGEIGRVLAVSESLMLARFSEADDVVKIPVGRQTSDDGEEDSEASASGRGCNFDLGYAVTCHKMQGSESPCVIILADLGWAMVASREWWYTAVSRASKVCVIIGQPGVIDKQCARQQIERRKTFLAELVREGIEKLAKAETGQEESEEGELGDVA